MFTPKKTKYRKMQKGKSRNRTFESRGTELEYGTYGIKVMDNCYITSRQIESGRRVLLRYTRKTGKIWIRIFPNKPITKKPPEVGMGKGKGDVDHYVFVAKPGRVVYEIDGVTDEVAMKALKQVGYKLPARTKIIKKI